MKDSLACRMRQRASNGMLKRIWKKVKGSRGGERCNGKEEEQTEDEGSQLSEPEIRTFPEITVANSTPSSHLLVNDVVFMPNHGDHNAGQEDDDVSVASASSGSISSCSSDGYLDTLEQEIIMAPSLERRLSERSITVENPGESRNSLRGEAPARTLKYGWTQFPNIEFESIPEGELTDGNDDDSTVRKKEEAFTTKEDRDVAVFTDIATRLAMTSLVHLVQGNESSQQSLPSSHLQLDDHAFAVTGRQPGSKPTIMKHPSSSPKKAPLVKQKHFRWAEVTDSKVRVVIHEVESVKDCKEMCWSPEELSAIKKEVIDAVQFFRQFRQNYAHSIEVVAKGNQEQSVIKDHMEQVMADSFPRGLETHIVKMLYDHRKSTIQSVLDKQKECKSNKSSPACTARSIREQSMAYSQLSTRFASSMARCDEIDALKAKMSRWRDTPASASGFFSS